MANVIFDLDGTVICSKHRANTLPDGSLDLVHWFENNTHEKIMQDSLLPLARVMRHMHNVGHEIVICTARSPHPANEAFLKRNRLPYSYYLSRATGCNMPDAALKTRLLTKHFVNYKGYSNVAAAQASMFDDNQSVINEMQRIGIRVFDARLANRNLERIN